MGERFERGQEVWIDNRRARLLEINAAGAPIVRFDGEQVTRVVPMHKVRDRPPDQPASDESGEEAS